MTAPFSAAEYDQRLSQVRDQMARQSLSASIITDPANLFYLTGYDAWSFYMPQCLIVPADGSPRLFLRAMDAGGAHYTARLPTDQIEGYPEDLVHHPDRHPFDWIARRGIDHGLLSPGSDGVIGIEADSHFFSPRSYLALAAALPDAKIIDSHELVNWVRVIKSDAEIARLRVAGTIAEQAMRTGIEAISPGMRQCDLAALILAAQAAGTPTTGGDYPSIVPMLPTGESAGTPHLTWSENPFQSGESTTIELAGVHQRYHAPLARTVSLGTPPQRLDRTARAVTEAMLEALAALMPGAPASDSHAAFKAVITRHGLSKDSRIGYSIGVGYPPDWGEHTVSLRAEETTVLRPGMAFHVIMGMWMDGWGYELSESVVIGAAGAERLTNLDQQLIVKR